MSSYLSFDTLMLLMFAVSRRRPQPHRPGRRRLTKRNLFQVRTPRTRLPNSPIVADAPDHQTISDSNNLAAIPISTAQIEVADIRTANLRRFAQTIHMRPCARNSRQWPRAVLTEI